MESLRPTSMGEEELQLQLALAMSKEEHAEELRRKKGDEAKLQMALDESRRQSSAAAPVSPVHGTQVSVFCCISASWTAVSVLVSTAVLQSHTLLASVKLVFFFHGDCGFVRVSTYLENLLASKMFCRLNSYLLPNQQR